MTVTVPAMRVLIRPEARKDLSDASAWYDNQGPGLGLSFLTAVRQQLLQIRSRPEAFPPFHRQTRRALIKRFPYAVIFLVQAEQERIIVIAVLHCGRDPRLWRARSQV